MSSLRKYLAKIDSNTFIFCIAWFVAGAGFLLGILSDPNVPHWLVISGFVIHSVIVFTVWHYINKAVCNRRNEKLARLRAEGVLPARKAQGDADVLCLANEEKREAAALLFWDMHGGNMDLIRTSLGIDKIKGGEMIIIACAILCSTVFIASELDEPGRIGPIICLLILAFVVAVAHRNNTVVARKNRDILRNGNFPQQVRIFLKKRFDS